MAHLVSSWALYWDNFLFCVGSSEGSWVNFSLVPTFCVLQWWLEYSFSSEFIYLSLCYQVILISTFRKEEFIFLVKGMANRNLERFKFAGVDIRRCCHKQKWKWGLPCLCLISQAWLFPSCSHGAVNQRKTVIQKQFLFKIEVGILKQLTLFP